MKDPEQNQEKPVPAGLIAGSISAVVSSLVSLPLQSPSDALVNSATVTLGTLFAGLAAGILWRSLANSPKRTRLFAALWALGFGLSVLFGVAVETQLERFFSFIVPLAAIVFVMTGILTAMLARRPIAARWWIAPAALVVAIGVGIGLAGHGDAESGRLELPPRASISLTEPE